MSTPELEEATGINRYTWQNIKNKKDREIKEIEIEAVVKLFPRYAYWITTGAILPEAGQISPDFEDLQGKASGQN